VKTTEQIVNQYYQAWHDKQANFDENLFTDDFKYISPLEEPIDATNFRAMAEQIVPWVSNINIIKQFVDGDKACWFYELVTNSPIGTLSIAEMIRVRDDQIAQINTYYDARKLSDYLPEI